MLGGSVEIGIPSSTVFDTLLACGYLHLGAARRPTKETHDPRLSFSLIINSYGGDVGHVLMV